MSGRIILLLPFFILINYFSFGQTNVGFRVGNGVSMIKSGSNQRGLGFSSPVWSYSFSSDYQKNIYKGLHFEASFGFARKGFAYNVMNYFEEESIRATRTMKVISIQVIPTYFVLERSKKQRMNRFGIQVGAYGSYLFNHKWKYAEEKPRKVNESMNPFDMGFVFGAILFRQNKKKIYTLDFRYFHGVLDVSTSADNTKVRTFEIGVGTMLNVKK